MIFPLKGGIGGNYVRMVRGKVVKKPISYCYTPYFDNEGAIGAIEVWQILEDEVLGKLYPWQYVPAASMSSRIEVLNFQALANFSQDVVAYHDVPFIYKLSARLLEEGNVHRLAQSDLPNLYMCFDIYALEAFGERNSRMGLNFLRKRGAKIMIEGIERAPVDVIAKYRPDAYLIDYRLTGYGRRTGLRTDGGTALPCTRLRPLPSGWHIGTPPADPCQRRNAT